MSFSSNATYFNNKKVADFNPEKGIESSQIAYRFRVDYDHEDGDISNMFMKFLSDPKLPEVDTFVVGMWGSEFDEGADMVVKLIVDNKDKLQQIKAVFIGDITYEENEVSWIENGDHGPVLQALPNLEIYKVRGGNGLEFSYLDHPKLKKLIIESGGLSSNIYEEISKANLPALEHLELWLGSDNYGFDAAPEDVVMAYRGVNPNHLPSLKYLGLRNSEIADELAELLKGDPILNRIEELDLSKGIIGDIGAQALLDNPAIKNLKKLDLHHNFISDELAEKLEELGIKVELKERDPKAPEDDRYIAVSE